VRPNLRYFNNAAPVRSLVIASAVSGEGKSTVAWNLALAEAQAGDLEGVLAELAGAGPRR
jgi:Mrp family chromosome partitioning ATPase